MRFGAIAFLAVILAACAHQPTDLTSETGAMPAPVLQVDQEGNYWWYARFQLAWGQGERVDFSKDLIVAHEIIAPLLTRYSAEIVLWRFHRRAVHDGAGHQFSFIFYSTPATARKIYADIGSDRVVKELRKSGELIALKRDDTAQPRRASIAGTSDHHWPAPIKNSWPYFIMGVSLMWLDLLEQTVDPHKLRSRPGVRGRLNYYREVEEKITRLWKQSGRHAFFHHINAIYGYEPLELVF